VKEGIVMYVFVVDLAEKLGTDKGNLFHRIKRDGMKTQLRPRMTVSGPQKMAVVPRWYADRLSSFARPHERTGREEASNANRFPLCMWSA